MALRKIISGGQTGANKAALDVAIKLGIPHGGWIPKGRPTEDGTVILEAVFYMNQMEETPMQGLPQAAAPRSVKEAVGQLISTRVFREKHLVANMDSNDLDTLHFSFSSVLVSV